MNAILKHTNRIPVEVRVTGEDCSTGSDADWAFLEFADEAEMIDFLRERMGKSENDVRLLLESYDEFSVEMTVKKKKAKRLAAGLLINGT